MITKKAKFTAQLIAVFILVVSMITVTFYQQVFTQVVDVNAYDDGKIQVTQSILGAVKPVNTTYKGRVLPGTTAFDLLKNQASIKTKRIHGDLVITEINGRKANLAEHEVWLLFLNGKPSETNVYVYKLKDGDVVEWRVEKL